MDATITWESPVDINIGASPWPLAIADRLNAFLYSNYIYLTWINPPGDWGEVYRINIFSPEKTGGYMTVTMNEEVTSQTALFTRYDQQRVQIAALVSLASGNEQQILEMKAGNTQKWSLADISIPSESGRILKVFQLETTIYFLGNIKDDNTPYTTLTTLDRYTGQFNYIGKFPVASNASAATITGFYPFSDNGVQKIMMASPDPEQNNQITTAIYNLPDLSQPLDVQTVSQDTTAAPVLAQGPDGTIIMAYTGVNKGVYTLTYDMEFNTWGESTKISDGDNSQEGIAPAIVETPLGLFVFYYDVTDDCLKYVKGNIEYPDPPDTGSETGSDTDS